MNTQNENEDTVQTAAYDPFPEPQTIPSGWDTSGFFAAPQAAPAVESDDSAESETK